MQQNYEQTLRNLKESNFNNEASKEQIDLLKQELFRVENTKTTEFEQMKAQLMVAREQLSQYEDIEKQLDIAISELDSDFVSKMPTTNKRRIQ